MISVTFKPGDLSMFESENAVAHRAFTTAPEHCPSVFSAPATHAGDGLLSGSLDTRFDAPAPG